MNPLLRTIAGVGTGWTVTKTMGVIARFSATSETTARKLHNRRSFTRNAVLGSTLLGVGGIGSALIQLLWPNKTGAFGGLVTIGASSIPAVGETPFRFQEGKFYVVHTEDGLEALYWKCVHLGCTVPWNEGQQLFVCPCHGSHYDYDGTRVAGPATRALDAMPITVNDDGSISVDTNPGSLVVRPEYRKEDAVPYPS